MARRNVDDQPSDPALARGLKFGGEQLDVPVGQKREPAVQFGEAARQERIEIRAHDRAKLRGGEKSHDASSFRRRVISRRTSASSADGAPDPVGSGLASLA